MLGPSFIFVLQARRVGLREANESAEGHRASRWIGRTWMPRSLLPEPTVPVPLPVSRVIWVDRGPSNDLIELLYVTGADPEMMGARRLAGEGQRTTTAEKTFLS